MAVTDQIDLTQPLPDPHTPEEADAYRAAQAEKRLEAEGVATVTTIPVDYFGTDETEKVFLPDGVSYVEFKIMTEGDRREYLKKTNRDIRVQKVTQDMVMRMDPGGERFELLKTAVVGWNLHRGGVPIPFSAANLELWLKKANPKTIDIVEKAVRLANPWLLAEVSIEDIDREIANLQELREKKLEEEEGKGSS